MSILVECCTFGEMVLCIYTRAHSLWFALCFVSTLARDRRSCKKKPRSHVALGCRPEGGWWSGAHVQPSWASAWQARACGAWPGEATGLGLHGTRWDVVVFLSLLLLRWLGWKVTSRNDHREPGGEFWWPMWFLSIQFRWLGKNGGGLDRLGAWPHVLPCGLLGTTCGQNYVLAELLDDMRDNSGLHGDR
jgi:hypothetical protein